MPGRESAEERPAQQRGRCSESGHHSGGVGRQEISPRARAGPHVLPRRAEDDPGGVRRVAEDPRPFGRLQRQKDVSFELREAESLGIVGSNGAGKSTLLKILSRITGPTHGRIDIWGRSASLLEVGTGFVPVLTGRENVYLNGSLLGMKRSEIKARFDQIVDFAEVENFIDVPVQRYSSGMAVRLAFAIARTSVRPCSSSTKSSRSGTSDSRTNARPPCGGTCRRGTVLLVSHVLDTIRSFCQKGMWLKRGQIEMMGDAKSVSDAYSEWCRSPETHLRAGPAGPVLDPRVRRRAPRHRADADTQRRQASPAAGPRSQLAPQGRGQRDRQQCGERRNRTGVAATYSGEKTHNAVRSTWTASRRRGSKMLGQG